MSRIASTAAVHNPVAPQYPGKAIGSEDMPPRVLDAIEDAEERDGEVIVASPEALSKDYAGELAFMEEPVVVYINRGREKHAPTHEHFGVNGKTIWIQVETPTRIKRKYLEVMARNMPMDVRTRSGESPGDEMTFNVVDRTLRSGFSFQVIKDENPRGPEWLAKVRRES